MAREVRSDGWWSEDGGMLWHHPAPDASVPMVATGGYKTVTIGSRIPTPIAVPNPIDAHLAGVRKAFADLDEKHDVAKLTAEELRRENAELKTRLDTVQARLAAAEAKLEKIRGHL